MAQAPKRIIRGEGVREGSRWIYERPTGEAVAEWFVQNAKLHEGMKHEPYIGGVVLIPAKEEVTVWDDNDNAEEVLRLTWTPYVKVETRVAYFWDLMALHADEWLGAIEPGRIPRVNTQGRSNEHLPPGYFTFATQLADTSWVQSVGCSMQARILKRSTVREVHGRLEGEPVIFAPAGTKTTTMLGRYGKLDENALEKVETGSVGRALGLAGILVLPGSGVASAEDMVEIAAAAATGGDAATSATLPADAPDQGKPKTPEELGRERILALISELESVSTDALEEFRAWAREKGMVFDKLEDKDLRVVLRQLERKLAAAKRAAKAKPPADETDGAAAADAPSVPEQTPEEGTDAEAAT